VKTKSKIQYPISEVFGARGALRGSTREKRRLWFRISDFEFRIFLLLPLLALASCQKAETPTPPEHAASPTPTPASASVTPNSFNDVTAQLDSGGDLYLYLSTAQWTAKLAHGVDVLQQMSSANQTPEQSQQSAPYIALLKDIIQKSGLQAVSGVGASSLNYAPGLYRNKVFLHHYPSDGSGIIWSLYGTQPHALTGLDFLPPATAAAGVGDFDLAQFIRFLRDEASQSGIPQLQQSVTQLQTQLTGLTGLKLDDVLDSLNGSIGIIFTLDVNNIVNVPIGGQTVAMPSPGLALLIAVKSDLIFKQVDKMLGGTPGVVKVDEPDLQMRSIALPFAPGLTYRPGIAQWNGFLIITSDDSIVRTMIAAQKGGPSFKADPEFATLSAGLPQQGNSFAVSTKRFADFIQKIQTQIYANQPHGAQQAALLQRFQKPGSFMSVGSILPNGWLTVSQGTQGAVQLLIPAVAAPAMAAAVTLPALNAFHHTAPPAQPGPPPIPPATSFPPGNPASPAPIPGTSP
jgi:hypothetical protein